MATDRISTRSGTPGVCPARTDRSGSAMVMITPIIKQEMAIMPSLFDLASRAPTFSPMGIMAISAPRVKKPMPMMSRNAPIRNSIIGARGIGVIVLHNSSTMAVMGSTAERDSLIFSFSSRLNDFPPFLCRILTPPIFHLHLCRKKKRPIARPPLRDRSSRARRCSSSSKVYSIRSNG